MYILIISFMLGSRRGTYATQSSLIKHRNFRNIFCNVWPYVGRTSREYGETDYPHQKGDRERERGRKSSIIRSRMFGRNLIEENGCLFHEKIRSRGKHPDIKLLVFKNLFQMDFCRCFLSSLLRDNINRKITLNGTDILMIIIYGL